MNCFCRTVVGLAWLFSLNSVFAVTVTVTGVAPLDAGPVAARELAIQDALSQAALSQGASINSTESMHNGVYHELGNVTALPIAGKVTILNERSEGGLYHLRAKIETDAQPAGTPKGAIYSACQNPTTRKLRRRLVTTYFTVSQPNEANDLPDLPTALPQEIANRLARHAMFSVVNTGGVSMMPSGLATEPAAGADSARILGHQQNAQFVVAGRVVSTAVTSRFLRASLFESSNTSDQGAYYVGPLSGFLGGAVKYAPNQRTFDVELWVYDALTGAVMVSERVSTLAQGVVISPLPIPFASNAFWSTDYGKAIDNALNEAVSRVGQTLACIPFSARVIEVESPGRIYINAGGLDGLEVGDQLLLYKEQSPGGLRFAGSDPRVGVPETLIGDVVILQVQPKMSVAMVRGGGKKAQQGNIVRYVPKR